MSFLCGKLKIIQLNVAYNSARILYLRTTFTLVLIHVLKFVSFTCLVAVHLIRCSLGA